MSFYKEILKPLIDYIAAFFLLIITFPFFLLIIFFYLFNGINDFLFFQLRIGRNDREFVLYKFKTYKTDLSLQKSLEEREYWFTDLFKKTGVDELPQLINILKGEMSFIGPRPLLPEYLSLYDEIQRKRHYVKPGITGLAQVNSDKIKNWQKRFELDVEYVEKISFTLDFKILLKTVHLIFTNRDIEELDKPFTGNE